MAAGVGYVGGVNKFYKVADNMDAVIEAATNNNAKTEMTSDSFGVIFSNLDPTYAPIHHFAILSIDRFNCSSSRSCLVASFAGLFPYRYGLNIPP